MTLRRFFAAFALLCALTIALGGPSLAYAAGDASQPINALDQVIGNDKTTLSNFGDRFHELSSTEPGADAITSIIFIAIDFLKYVLGTVAVVFATISGVKLVAAGGKVDEVSEKEKDALKYIFYGLVVVMIADQLVTKVFFGQYGECITSASNAQACAATGSTLIKGIYSFIMALMASISILIIVMAAFRMIMAYGNEDDIGKQKRHIGAALIALLISGVAEFVVKGIVFPEGGTQGINVAGAQGLVYSFTNFVAGFIGTAAFLVLFYGGYLYVTSFGNEEETGKAKKIIAGAVIGILIALGSFAVVTTLTTLTGRGDQVNLPKNIPGQPVSPPGN